LTLRSTPLTSASCRGYVEVVDLLLEYGAAKDFRDENGWTPLLIASLKGHAQVVKTLINAGTNINFQNVQVIILPSPETDGCIVFSR